MNYFSSELKATEVNTICIFYLTPKKKKKEEIEKNPQKVTLKIATCHIKKKCVNNSFSCQPTFQD